MDGWIKLHRRTLDNPVVCKDADHLAVWVYLLLKASHNVCPVFFRGEKTELRPGQLITGRLKIADDLSINESKVKRILQAFKSDQQIDQQTSNKNSLITILNWDVYQKSDQQNDQQMTSKRPADDQQVTTNKNERIKECKKKDIKREVFAPPTPEAVKEYCLQNGYQVDAERFVDFYSSKGWMVGKNKMKDWKAAVRSWSRSQRQESTAKAKSGNQFNNFHQREYDMAELERQLLTGGSKDAVDGSNTG